MTPTAARTMVPLAAPPAAPAAGPPSAGEVAALYVGSVVGAGFASGREVVQFFALHGERGLWGTALAVLGFLGVGGLVLGAALRLRSGSYRELLLRACGPRAAGLLELGLLGFSWAGVAVMLAGAGAAARQVGLPFGLGSWGTLVAVWLCLRRRLSGVLAANRLLVPVLTAILVPILCLGLAGGDWGDAAPGESPGFAGFGFAVAAPGLLPGLLGFAGLAGASWALSALLYVGYNSLVVLVALAPLGRAGCRGGAWGGPAGAAAWLGGLLALECAATLALGPAAGRELPVAVLAHRAGPLASALYLVALWCALFTTALALAWGLQARLSPGGRAASSGLRRTAPLSPQPGAPSGPPGPGMLLLLASAGAMAHTGFGRLVAVVYPVSGLLGAVTLAFLAVRFPRGRGSAGPAAPRGGLPPAQDSAARRRMP